MFSCSSWFRGITGQLFLVLPSHNITFFTALFDAGTIILYWCYPFLAPRWMDPLFWLGCRHNLQQTDLYAHPRETDSERVLNKFQQVWEHSEAAQSDGILLTTVQVVILTNRLVLSDRILMCIATCIAIIYSAVSVWKAKPTNKWVMQLWSLIGPLPATLSEHTQWLHVSLNGMKQQLTQ